MYEGRGGSTIRVSGAAGGRWVAWGHGSDRRTGGPGGQGGGNGGRTRAAPVAPDGAQDGGKRPCPGGDGYAETARDQSGAVPVTRHRARYSGIGGVYGTVPCGRWMSRAVPVTRAPTA